MKRVIFLLMVFMPFLTLAQTPSDVTTAPNGSVTVGCTGDSVTITLGGTYPSYTYIWNTGSTVQNLKVKNSGSYTVTVTDANTGSSAVLPAVTINFNPQILSSIILPNGTASVCQGGTVKLQAQPSGAAGYAWNESASPLTILSTSDSLIVNSTGDYSVTVTSANGCTSIAHQHVDVYALPEANISISPANGVLCEGAGGITLSANVLPAATYHWSNGETTQSINVTAPGTTTFDVTVTNSNGCSKISASKTITIMAQPTVSVSALGSTAICKGSSVVLQATPGFNHYLWNNGIANVDHITVSAGGDYNVQVSDGNGCSKISTSITIIENPLPVASIAVNGAQKICEGDSTQLVASGGSSYLWNNGTIGAVVYAKSTGDYVCTVTDVNGCTAEASTSIVVQNSAISIVSNVPGNVVCANKNILVLSVNDGFYDSYQWQMDGSSIAGATNSSYQPTQSGTYTVMAVNACSQSLISNSIYVTVIVTPTVYLDKKDAQSSTIFCAGDSLALVAKSGVVQGAASTSYIWLLNGQEIATTIDSIYIAKEGGSYQVMAINECSTSEVSNKVDVTVLQYNTPTFDTTAIQNNPLCPGGVDKIVLTASPNGDVSWQWMKDGAPLLGETNQSISITQAGVYSLSETNSCTGLMNSDISYTVRVSNTPSISLSFSNPNYKDSLCQGDAVFISAVIGGDYSGKEWYFNGKTTGNMSNSIAAETSGTYTMHVHYRCGPDITVSQALVFKSLPIVSISSSNGYDLCKGDITTLKVEDAITDHNSYVWSTGASTQSIEVSEDGIYRVTVTGKNGCRAIALSGAVIYNDSLPVGFYETPSPENGLKIIFTDNSTSNAISYEWSFGNGDESTEKNPIYTYAEKGVYMVRLKISDGKCSNTAYRKIVVEDNVRVFPPAISPNGDGINDVFKVNKNVELVNVIRGEIFDRWGKKVADLQNGQWDGRSTNGEEVSNSVYFYVVKLKFPDGTDHIEKGSVNVYR